MTPAWTEPLADMPIREQARHIARAPWCYSAGDVSRVIMALLGEPSEPGAGALSDAVPRLAAPQPGGVPGSRAPARIMAWGAFGPGSVTGEWSANTYDRDDAVGYTRDDQVQTDLNGLIDLALQGAAARIAASADSWQGRDPVDDDEIMHGRRMWIAGMRDARTLVLAANPCATAETSEEPK